MQDYFADMVGNIAITGNLVRIDYMRLAGADSEKKQLKFEPSYRLVMPVEGFLRSLDMMEKIKQKLIDDGVLKPSEKTVEKPSKKS
jgi:hypothetical protein